MFLLQKNVPNLNVIKIFVFAYFTMALITIYSATNSQRDYFAYFTMALITIYSATNSQRD